MNFLERSTTTLLHPRRTTGDRYDTVAEIVHSLQNRISVLYAELESKHTIATSKIKKEMQSIVDTNQQLLHLARIGSGMYERDRVQLSSIIAREVEEFQWKCDMEHIELTSIIEREVVCMGNAVLLAELVRLLVHNACKYRSPERSAVVCVLLRSSPRVTFEVIDNGIGIPEEDVPRVFEKWFRSSFVVERYEGTGLGLAVAHQIVTFHKGTITVQSTWGNGTRVCVTL